MVRDRKEGVCEDVYLERVIVGLHSAKENVLLELGRGLSSFSLKLVKGFQ